MKVHKGVNLCEEKNWLILAGRNAFMVWDYLKDELIFKKEFEEQTRISAAQLCPKQETVWVTAQDQSIMIYEASTWNLIKEIPINGTYSPALVFHQNGKHFLYTRMEQGGSEIFMGDVENYSIDWSKELCSNSYILANISFSSKGDYILFTDAGFHVYKYPELKLTYKLDEYTCLDPNWESPQYPSDYMLCLGLPLFKEKQFILLVVNGSSLSVQHLEPSKKGLFYFVPLADYNTKIEDVCNGEALGIFYISDYLGGIHKVDVQKALKNLAEK